MSYTIQKGSFSLDTATIHTISTRYKTITKAVNRSFWESESDTSHSFYVGSYGRNTSIDTSDIDILVVLPDKEFIHFNSLSGNGPSRLLQAVKNALSISYPNSNIKGDGQVVVIEFSDNMRFEILPAFENKDSFGFGNGTYRYPDTHKGGKWKSTDPKAEQAAMREMDDYNHTNGLLTATCKSIRYIRDTYFSSYHLSGILIDAFVYNTIKGWHFLRDGERKTEGHISFEEHLFNEYKQLSRYSTIYAPGSNDTVGTQDWETLGKVLRKMV